MQAAGLFPRILIAPWKCRPSFPGGRLDACLRGRQRWSLYRAGALIMKCSLALVRSPKTNIPL